MNLDSCYLKAGQIPNNFKLPLEEEDSNLSSKILLVISQLVRLIFILCLNYLLWLGFPNQNCYQKLNEGLDDAGGGNINKADSII